MKLVFPGINIQLLLVALLFSCHRNPETSVGLQSSAGIDKAILEVNRYIVKRNRDHIQSFLRRTGWEMQQTGSGLRIMILQEGRGRKALAGQKIRMEYNLKLIDGTEISSSAGKGPLEFNLMQGGVESGLEEAVSLLKIGSSARIIIPPHLAFGNFGNTEKKIPPDAILLYEIKILSIL